LVLSHRGLSLIHPGVIQRQHKHRQRVEEIAAQLPAVQEQMTRDISNKLEAVEQNIVDKVSAAPQR
jgi:hypothetical protein